MKAPLIFICFFCQRCEKEICFLHGSWSGIWTCDPPDGRHRIYHWATTPNTHTHRYLHSENYGLYGTTWVSGQIVALLYNSYVAAIALYKCLESVCLIVTTDWTPVRGRECFTLFQSHCFRFPCCAYVEAEEGALMWDESVALIF